MSTENNDEQEKVAEPRRWRWYHGLFFYLVIQGLVILLYKLTLQAQGDGRKMSFGDQPYYRSLRQSIFSPPGWVFGPAWTINNISTIWGGLRVINKPLQTPGRSAFIALQAATWVDYVSFNAAYFGLRSPINAFVLTLVYFVLTIASLFVALFQLNDRKAAASLATTIAWLLLAGTAATFQAAWNHDPLYNAGPFTKPNPKLLKK